MKFILAVIVFVLLNGEESSAGPVASPWYGTSGGINRFGPGVGNPYGQYQGYSGFPQYNGGFGGGYPDGGYPGSDYYGGVQTYADTKKVRVHHVTKEGAEPEVFTIQVSPNAKLSEVRDTIAKMKNKNPKEVGVGKKEGDNVPEEKLALKSLAEAKKANFVF